AAAFAGALTLLTARWLLIDFVPCQPNYAILLYVPWIIAATVERDLGWRDAWVLAALLVLQGAVSAYLAGAGLGVVGGLAPWRLAWRRSRADGGRLAAAWMLAGSVLVVLFAAHLVVRVHEPNVVYQTMWRFGVFPEVLPWGLFVQPRPTRIVLASVVL